MTTYKTWWWPTWPKHVAWYNYQKNKGVIDWIIHTIKRKKPCNLPKSIYRAHDNGRKLLIFYKYGNVNYWDCCMTNITVTHNNLKYQIQMCDKWVPKSGCLTPLHYRQNICNQSPLTNTHLFISSKVMLYFLVWQIL
jgi:hypothetical protein